jgi:hypothetical protein
MFYMSDEFLMPIFGEEGLSDMILQQEGTPPHFHNRVWKGLLG